jgi:hypothetical protein
VATMDAAMVIAAAASHADRLAGSTVVALHTAAFMAAVASMAVDLTVVADSAAAGRTDADNLFGLV